MVNLQWGYLTNVLCASVCCLKPSCTCERQINRVSRKSEGHSY